VTTEVTRPLVKRVGGDAEWHISVREMPHKAGFSYPVFEWSFGRKDGIRGGELRAWPLQGHLVFTDRRESRDWKFTELEEALAKIDEYSWGEPPHIDEVFQDVLNTKKQLPAENVGAAKAIFEELWQKWEALATSAS